MKRRARPDDASGLSRAAKIADLLDTRFVIPGTPIRFGWDTILGLLPGIGDSIALILASAIVFEARARGARKRVLFKMLLNMGIDWLFGLVPIVGDVADLFFKSNARNLKLLEAEMARMADVAP